MARSRVFMVFVLAACVRTTPQPPPEPPLPPAPAVKVPEGCLDSFAGSWVHANDRSYRYEAVDDGGTLTLVVSHQPVVDAGFSPRRFRPVADAGAPDSGVARGVDAGLEPDAGNLTLSAVRVELERTADGFVGATLAPLVHPTGRICEARFPTRVISCADGGLLLESQSATALGDACQPPARPLGLSTRQHRLVRPDAG